jgi:hypothetical protein
MRHHGVEELVVGERRVVEAQLVVGRALPPQHRPHRDAHAADQLGEFLARRRGLQVLDDARLDAAVADQPEDVAGRAAGRVVVDRHLGQGSLLSPVARAV